jgi:hypothetical protein
VRQRAPVQDAPHAGVASTPVPWPGAIGAAD